MRQLSVLLVIAITVMTPMVFCCETGADGNTVMNDSLLVDYGNGSSEWYSITPDNVADTILSTVCNVLTEEDIELSETSDGKGLESVNGVKTKIIGDLDAQTCSWRFYIWTFEWEYGGTNGSEQYSGGSLAIGFYPSETIQPPANPEYPEVWTCNRGDSSNSTNSASYGPGVAATPLEWYISYETGGIYSSLLVADGLIYHTTGGNYNSIGADTYPSIYCVDTVNKEVAWKLQYENGTYEVSTPLIVGDMLIVTSSNGHVYCLDRFDGSVIAELVPAGEMPHFANSFDTTEYVLKQTLDENYNWMLEGAQFITGPTTAIYDSGAIYFNTYDGQIRCYSIDREKGFRELWTYSPSVESDRGCFYYSPPTVYDRDGTAVIISGSYSGRGYCVDAATGEEIWVKKFIDLGEGNPGSVTSITPCSGSRALITCNDGTMNSLGKGHLLLIDVNDGSIIWKSDIKCSKPVVVGETFYTYLSPAFVGAEISDKNGKSEIAEGGYYALRVSDGNYIWKNASSAVTKSGLAYCDGRLYSLDYSPGTSWPDGGALRCIDPDSGEYIWIVKLEPFTGNSYTMSAPTIVGGKVYVANDGGILYCISEIAGKDISVTQDLAYGPNNITHWSWILTIISSVVVAGVSILAYRM